MENLINQINKVLAVLMFSFSCFLYSQQNSNPDKQVRLVFNQLVSFYGSAKPAPELLVDKYVLPASYKPNPNPIIKVDIKLYKLCQTFGKDSLNALAVVLSHELTHYYNDHTFCSDFAFVNFKSNPELQKKIGQASFSSKIEKESQADIKGFFYALASGFHPHGLQGELIKKIYSSYNLTDKQNGYPSKQERIEIAIKAEKTATQLYEHFKNGLIALENKQYDQAIEYFNKANSQVPFRENWNNIGVAKARKALLLKVKTSEEYKFPDRFLYPLEVENKSRLAQETTRSNNDRAQQMTELLLSAQKDFQEAIRLDPKFTKGYINLACVYELLGKYNLALGTIEELTKEQQNSNEAQRILAITYYHNNQETNANSIWSALKM